MLFLSLVLTIPPRSLGLSADKVRQSRPNLKITANFSASRTTTLMSTISALHATAGINFCLNRNTSPYGCIPLPTQSSVDAILCRCNPLSMRSFADVCLHPRQTGVAGCSLFHSTATFTQPCISDSFQHFQQLINASFTAGTSTSAQAQFHDFHRNSMHSPRLERRPWSSTSWVQRRFTRTPHSCVLSWSPRSTSLVSFATSYVWNSTLDQVPNSDPRQNTLMLVET
jgi:hypothetical protein